MNGRIKGYAGLLLALLCLWGCGAEEPENLQPIAASPFSVPGAPTSVQAVAGNAQAQVTWVAPVNDGHRAVTRYTVRASPGGATVNIPVGSTTSAMVTGLANGTTYSFTVVATNSEGDGPASEPSNSVTPGAPPGAPGLVSATAGDAQVSLVWEGPVDMGTTPIAEYLVKIQPGDRVVKVPAGETRVTVKELTNGTAYTFTVAASNAAGSGLESAPLSATPLTVPAAPSEVTTNPLNAVVVVSWTAPSDGGTPIAKYTVTVMEGETLVKTQEVTTTSATVEGLTNGTFYTFTVVATNAVGQGPASTPVTVKPRSPPSSVRNLQGQAGDGQVLLTWEVPLSDGGCPIVSYKIWEGTGTYNQPSTTELSGVVTGLTNGRRYEFYVTATNDCGLTKGSDTIWVTLSAPVP